MNEPTDHGISDRWILSNRGKKNAVDTRKPYGWLVEKERTTSGKIEDTAIIFLTNSECRFHCLMCDLWKNTTDEPVPAGAIPDQIEWVLNKIPDIRHVKLYNSGSFFDEREIPGEDYDRIGSLLRNFNTVVVESHPRLINEKVLRFRDILKTELQVAIGLETVHREVLRKLNKRMTTEDFSNSVDFLTRNQILSRAFILLRPPFLSESEGINWARKSIDFAFSSGVECCTVIPVRPGNGAMDRLMEMDLFTPPRIQSLEKVLEYGISLKSGRVFADVWDLSLFSSCEMCYRQRSERLKEMNMNQVIPEPVLCACDSNHPENE